LCDVAHECMMIAKTVNAIVIDSSFFICFLFNIILNVAKTLIVSFNYINEFKFWDE
jgi:hypothetical protein